MIYNIAVRIADGKHFDNAMPFKTWCLNSTAPMGKHFMKIVNSINEGDTIRLWFLKTGSNGIASYVATFDRMIRREIGPLLNVTVSSEDFGWGMKGDTYDMEVRYKDIYEIQESNVNTGYKSQSSWGRLANSPEDLDLEYPNIVRYSKSVSM